MARQPAIFISEGMLQVSEPGFDASDPNLSPDQVRFSTAFRGMGCLRQVIAWNDLEDITAFPLDGAPWQAPPLCVLALHAPANILGANAGDSNLGLLMGAPILVNDGRALSVTAQVQMLAIEYVALADDSNIYVDPFWSRVAVGIYGMQEPLIAIDNGWVFAFDCPRADQATPATGVYRGAEDGIPALKVVRNDADPRNAQGADIFYSSDKELGVVVQEGSVDTLQGNVDITIPDLGFKPVVFFHTDRGAVGMVRHLDDTTLRFYQRVQPGAEAADYKYYAVYATPMPGLV